MGQDLIIAGGLIIGATTLWVMWPVLRLVYDYLRTPSRGRKHRL